MQHVSVPLMHLLLIQKLIRANELLIPYIKRPSTQMQNGTSPASYANYEVGP